MTAAVFDCMVFLQAATNDRGPAFACLELVEANEVTLYVTPGIVVEVRDVLTRPKIQGRFPNLTPERVEMFLQKIATLAVLANEAPSADFLIRDADDLPYLNLAVSAKVEYIVSRDNDLLDLMKDAVFTIKFPQLRVVDPTTFLMLIRQVKRS